MAPVHHRMVPGWSSANMNNPVPSLKPFVSVNYETVPFSLENCIQATVQNNSPLLAGWGVGGIKECQELGCP